MIKVDRADVIQPGVTFPDAEKYQKELTKALVAYHEWLDSQSEKLPTLKYKLYGDRDIRQQLSKLFHGKCAYCESVYASTAPMDVEHWRPKKAVDRVLGSRKRTNQIIGYYWLAADWDNLLPSCIDCNRERNQVIDGDGNLSKGGKQNYFPVHNDDFFCLRENAHDEWLNEGDHEVPLLINPCLEDPEAFFRYEDGLVFPLPDLDSLEMQKAKTSIRVYGLNRSELVRQRFEWQLLIHARLFSINHLVHLLGLLERDGARSSVIELTMSILEHERSELELMQSPQKPFTGMSRQLIREGLSMIMQTSPAAP